MRVSKDQYYLDIALAVLKRSTCLKRRYGCVIVNHDEIIATGYNGSIRGYSNCCDLGICQRPNDDRNSGNYGLCKSIHAEQNALISASRKDLIGSTLYLSCENYTDGEWVEDNSDMVQACPICNRMITNAGVSRIVNRYSLVSDKITNQGGSENVN